MSASLVPKKQQILEWYFPDLVAEIEQAQELLNLPDNYDGEGAKPPTRAALAEATFFLRRGATWFCRETGETIPAPKIMQDGDGGIDLLWESRHYVILVNFRGTQVDENGRLNHYPSYVLEGHGEYIEGVIPNIFFDTLPIFVWIADHA